MSLNLQMNLPFLGTKENSKGKVETFQQGLDYFEAIGMPVRNLATRSRTEYKNDLADLFEFLNRRGIFHLKDVNLQHLEIYQAVMDHRGYKASTRNRKTHAIKSFFKFLHHHNITLVNIARRLIPPPAKRLEPRFLSEAEYQRLLLACGHNPQDTALIEMLLQTGMLLSEIAQLTIYDVDIPEEITPDVDNTGVVRVKRKGGEIESLLLNYKACHALATWLKVRPKVEHVSLFVANHKTPMSKRTIQYTVDKYMRRARIEEASVQTLRHTMAIHYLAKGGDLQTLHGILGNDSLETTKIYAGLAKKIQQKMVQNLAL